jgi:DNA repair exonuclease SbcCD ATPase subunit
VETIKKLANSRMANITKSFEEKLTAKERELEDISITMTEQLGQMRSHVAVLEEQLKKAGFQPTAAPAAASSDDKLLGEIERLRKENAVLRSKAGSNSNSDGSGGGSDSEVRELKKMIDNLMEANSKLVTQTKSKVAMLESEIERYKTGGGGGGGGGGGELAAGSAQIATMQKRLEDESNERKKATDEVARLRKELEQSNAAVQKSSGDASAHVKDLQKSSNELTKQLGQKDAQIKAQLEDFALKEKDFMRQVWPCPGSFDMAWRAFEIFFGPSGFPTRFSSSCLADAAAQALAQETACARACVVRACV